MSRLVYSFMFAFSVCLFSISAGGCGSEGNTVIEDTRTEADIAQEEADYDQMMDASDDVTE